MSTKIDANVYGYVAIEITPEGMSDTRIGTMTFRRNVKDNTLIGFQIIGPRGAAGPWCELTEADAIELTDWLSVQVSTRRAWAAGWRPEGATA